MGEILLDEHVGRVFERTLGERGYSVRQATDELGEQTMDHEILERCAEDGSILITNNARGFEPLHREHDHAGILLYRDQDLPDTDPEGLARTVEMVFEQYEREDLGGQLVELDEWYDWLHK